MGAAADGSIVSFWRCHDDGGCCDMVGRLGRKTADSPNFGRKFRKFRKWQKQSRSGGADFVIFGSRIENEVKKMKLTAPDPGRSSCAPISRCFWCVSADSTWTIVSRRSSADDKQKFRRLILISRFYSWKSHLIKTWPIAAGGVRLVHQVTSPTGGTLGH